MILPEAVNVNESQKKINLKKTLKLVTDRVTEIGFAGT